MTRSTRARLRVAVLGTVLLVGCGSAEEEAPIRGSERVPVPADAIITVLDTLLPGGLRATGMAEPLRRATLSTRVMASVREVLVEEGDRVQGGQLLLRMDPGELLARREQVEAGLAGATAQRDDARRHAERIRRLFADSAAPRAMLDAAETNLLRAEAGVRAAQGAESELTVVEQYSRLTAPFRGRVVRRLVDPGAFVAPGTPLLDLEDASSLRIRVEVPPDATAGLRPGMSLAGSVEGRDVVAIVEGVVPGGGAGGLHVVNALVPNPEGRLPSGGSAMLHLTDSTRTRTVVLVPVSSILQEGDLTGVLLVGPDGTADRRWVRLGRTVGDRVEVVSGLAVGDRVADPARVRVP